VTKEKIFITLTPDDRPATLAQCPTVAMMDNRAVVNVIKLFSVINDVASNKLD
jgi:hypothetical protein